MKIPKWIATFRAALSITFRSFIAISCCSIVANGQSTADSSGSDPRAGAPTAEKC